MAVDGNWKVTVQSPIGAQEAVLTLKSDGAALSGSAKGAMGAADITDGKVAGDKATFAMAIQQPFPMTLEYELTVDGDKISGTVKAGSFGAFPASGVRVA
ncbi:MAG: hypothetical protein AB7M12_01770 [Hyphomonadaceae bacterium]